MKGKADATEQLLHLVIEGRTTHDHFLKLSAECLDELGTDLAVYHFVHAGYAQEIAHRAFLEDGAQLVAVDLLKNEGHTYDEVGLT